MRALGLAVTLKSGMVASSQDFGKLLLNTLAKSDVRKTTSETWALMFTLEGGPVSALLFDDGTGRRSEQEVSRTYAFATLRGGGFSLAGFTRSRCMACSSLGSLRRRCEHFEGRRQMSHVTARPGDGGA